MTDYQREAQRDQAAENAARQGWAFSSATTTGLGTVIFKKAVNFGLSFYEKPYFHYGMEIVDLDDSVDISLVPVPNSSGFVHEWVQNQIGDYVGAYVGVTVMDYYLPTTSALKRRLDTTGNPWAGIQVEHHFTFTAKAWKDTANVGGEDLPADTGGGGDA